MIKFFRNFGLGQEKDYLIENLSLLLASGITITSALEAIKVEIRSQRIKRIVTALEEDVQSGMPLWRALEGSRLFAPHVISLVKIGEEAGRLSENLKVIAEEEQKDRMFRSKIHSAMMYPVFVFTLTVVIGIGIAWFILPRLALVFSELNIKLPFVTRVLIALGKFLGKYGAIVIPILLLATAVLVYFLFIFRRTKFIGQFILFKIPGVGKLIKEVELARMGYILGTLLTAGLTAPESLGSLAEASTSFTYRNLYAFLKDHVETGDSFQKSFRFFPKINSLIPTPIEELIVTGEKSGRMADTFLKIAEIFESKTDITTKNLTVILEPILLVIVWLGVVAVALAVILPIYSLIGSFNK